MNGKLSVLGVTYSKLFGEVNRLRARDGLEEIGGLHFAHKVHQHVLVETNPRVAEAIDNLKKAERPAVQPDGQS